MAVDMTNVSERPLNAAEPITAEAYNAPRSGRHDGPGGPAPLRVESDSYSPQHGWLIEVENGLMPLWLKLNVSGITWTSDSSEALRFARKQDAETFRTFARLGTLYVVTEHTWS